MRNLEGRIERLELVMVPQTMSAEVFEALERAMELAAAAEALLREVEFGFSGEN